ncbi:MAG: glutamate 5-kinase [Chloroflexi bacterium RBG_13_60_13]|nr:MAG: glutamate 5-kinase [Chloroflexi bacterium RBG_13_60_13]
MEKTKGKQSRSSKTRSGYRRLVIKFGTNLLTGGTRHLDLETMANLVDQVARLHREDRQVVIVSSGAIAAGRAKLGLDDRNRKDIPFKQTLAAVGQGCLMHTYEQLFSQHNIVVAQALLTKRDLSHRAGYLNGRNTLLSLLDLRVVPIINENDVVATDEIKGDVVFGDNDNLSAMVANLIDADLLMLLSDVAGLYTADPRSNPKAKLLPTVSRIDADIEQMAGGAGSTRGTGGMATKIQAAKLATSSAIAVIITDGSLPNVITRLAQGDSLGTLFLPRTTRLESRKRWMVSRLASRGKIIVDDGAAAALKRGRGSLLPAGIVDTDRDFQRGDLVDIVDLQGSRIACGMSNYSATDIQVIKGTRSGGIASLLGYEYGAEAVHRNNLAVL